ncbi:MAG TPA: hypothetical protein VK934_06240, partial [Fimbriimonas sp.]|nr:hypothetical protein [Fimbriimonas sp.]
AVLSGATIVILSIALGIYLDRAAGWPPSWLWSRLALLAVGGCFLSILAPVFYSARYAGYQTTDHFNLKHLGQAHLLYATENQDRLPPGPVWRTATSPYVIEEVTSCPRARTKSSYAMNQACSALSLNDIVNANTVLLFEIDSNLPNPVGGANDVTPRHEHRPAFYCLDGHVIRNRPTTVRWNPK